MNSNRPKPTVLVILDGFGCSNAPENNAIAIANTPVWDDLWSHSPHTTLECSGAVVGLPDGQMGNSEVGHLHLGGGRLLPQDFTRINNAIADGSFYSNKVLQQAISEAKENNRALHVLGLLSPGGVHSHDEHLQAMVEMAVNAGVKKVYVHAFLDGRDTPPRSAQSSLEGMEALFKKVGGGQFASLCGRFYAMDRDKRWERVEKAYNVVALGQGEFTANSAVDALKAAYERDESDEFVEPTVILSEQGQPIKLEDGDVAVFMNFRADRAREISEALAKEDFDGFERKNHPVLGTFVTLTEYQADFTFPIAYPPMNVTNSLGEVISRAGLTQLRLAETEKYAHVTFFFNGGKEEAFAGEERVLVPSPKVKTYDMQPEMSAAEVTDKLVEAINGKVFDTIVVNYANGDMVGHTGVLDAAVTAVETLDASLGRVVEAIRQVGGALLITADHGNAEQMVDPSSGQTHTAHTVNPVPLVYVGPENSLADGGSLMDVAPTVLAIMGLEQPAEMSGRSLLKN